MHRLQSLSALADGELDPAAAALACAHWRGDATARVSWHAYHLIGDVMRSEELASHAARDARFLRAVSQRLAAEPVVLSPQPIVTTARSMPLVASRAPAPARRARWSWMAPAAVAAGFMAVASVLVVTRGTAPADAPIDGRVISQGGGQDAARMAMPVSRLQTGSADPAGDPATLFSTDQVVRDARLERYFAAHKQFGGSSALNAPSGFLRAATTQMPDR